jgi:hypothetical protein
MSSSSRLLRCEVVSLIFSLYLLKFSYPSVSKCVYTVLKIFFEESEEGL